MADIFISYRRSDSSDVTGRIFDHLKSRFGEPRLFKDVDSIPLGSDFRTVIADAVTECKVLLAIIGVDWLDVADERGRRRIDDPNDFVHIEVATALSRQIPVIPILVDNTTMPKSAVLPDALKELAFRNATPVRADPDFLHDIDRLNSQLAKYVDLKPSRFQISRRHILWAMTATLIISALIITAVLWPRSGANTDSLPNRETAELKRELEELRVVVGEFDELRRQFDSRNKTDEILEAWKQSQDRYTTVVNRLTDLVAKVRPIQNELSPDDQSAFKSAQALVKDVDGCLESVARLLLDSWRKTSEWHVRAISIDDVISGLELLERFGFLKEGVLNFIDQEPQIRIAEHAISDFQRMQGIFPDGIMGRPTWNALNQTVQLKQQINKN